MAKLKVRVVDCILVEHFVRVDGARKVGEDWEQGRVQTGCMREPRKIAISNQAIKVNGTEILNAPEHIFQFAELVLGDHSLGYIVEYAFVDRI